MSYYFSVQADAPVTYQQFANQLANPNVQYSYAPDNADAMLEGTKIFIPHRSTRGITIGFEDEGYSVGINIVSSEEDFILAIKATHALATLTGGAILPEDHEAPVPLAELEQQFDANWIDQMKTLGIHIFMNNIGNEGHLLTIGCCQMQYHIGPRIHATLNTSSEEAYYNSLVHHIQSTQFFNQANYYIPNLLGISGKDDDDKGYDVLVFPPNGRVFLRKADYILLRVTDDSAYEVPFDLVAEFADEKFTMVDEIQYTVEELSAEEYQALLERVVAALGKTTNEQYAERMRNCSNAELTREFWRVMQIPNARTKIFCLEWMHAIMKEHESRGIPLPGDEKKSGKATTKSQSQPAIEPKPEKAADSAPPPQAPASPPPSAASSTKKPWWKFW